MMSCKEDPQGFPLHDAIINGDVKLLSNLLDQGEKIDLQDEFGNTALHLAAYLGFAEALDVLLDHKVSLDLHNRLGETPLFLAVKGRHVPLVVKLLERGANRLAQDKRGNIPPALTVQVNVEDGVDLLFKETGSITLHTVFGLLQLHVSKHDSNLLLEKVLRTVDGKRECSIENLRDISKKRTFLQLAILVEFEVRLGMCFDKLDPSTVTKDNIFFIEQLMHKMTLLCNSSGLIKDDFSLKTPLEIALSHNLQLAIHWFLTKAISSTDDLRKTSYPLHVAVLKNNENRLREFLKKGFGIESKDNHCRTPLHWAIMRNFSAGIEILLSNGADVNAKDSFGNTAFYYSVLRQNVSIMEYLFRNGADINHKNNDGVSIFHLAVKNNFQAGVVFLLAKGVDVNVKDKEGNTVLHIAVEMAQFKECEMAYTYCIKILLTSDQLHLNALNSRRWTALNIAAECGLELIVYLLLDNGADVNAQFEVNDHWYLPLHNAVDQMKPKQNINIVRRLCEMGAKVNVPTDYEFELNYPLHLAARRGFVSAVILLLEKGADVNARDCSRNNALHYVTRNAKFETECLKIVNILLKYGIDINMVNKDRPCFTPVNSAIFHGLESVAILLIKNGAEVDVLSLHLAVHKPEISNQFVEKLLSSGIDPNKELDDYFNPWELGPVLHAAVEQSSHHKVSLLLEYGADVNLHSMGKSVLHLAAGICNCTRYPSILEQIIMKGPYINKKDKYGTALNSAINRMCRTSINLLLENNINVNEVNYQGNTALLHVLSEPYRYIRQVILILISLLKHGADINEKTTCGNSVLHLASINFETQVVQFLLERNLNINELNNLGNTPLHEAICIGNEEVVRHLINFGANLNLKNNGGDTCLKTAVKCKLTGCLALMQQKSPININAQDIKGNTCVHDAVLLRNEDLLNLLLMENPDINIRNEDSLTATCLAATMNFQSGVRILLQREIQSKTHPDEKKEQELLYAVLKINVQLIELFMRGNIDINYKRSKSALHLAVLRNFELGVIMLIKAGANVNDKDLNGNTSLHMAAVVKSPTIMKILLSNCASVYSINNDGRTALHLAALIDFSEGVEILLEHGALLHFKDVKGKTALYLAMSKQNININNKNIQSNLHLSTLMHFEFGVKALVEAGTRASDNVLAKIVKNDTITNMILPPGKSVQCKYTNHINSVELANLTDFSKGIEKFIRRSRDADLLDKEQNTPFYLVMPDEGTSAKLELHLATLKSFEFGVKMLIKAGANVNLKGVQGNTPLHLASIVRNAAILEMLLTNGAIFDIRNDCGRTPLHLASLINFIAGIDLILDQGASPDLQDCYGNTPLHLAISKQNTELAIKLIQFGGKKMLTNGVKLGIRNDCGRTPLHLASMTNFIVGIDLILDQCASPDLQDCYGNTPLHLAMSKQNIDLAIKLIKFGAKMDIINKQGESFFSMRTKQRLNWNLEEEIVKLKIALAENNQSIYDPHRELLNVEMGDCYRSRSYCKIRNSCREEIIKMKSQSFGNATLLDLLKDHKDPKFIVNEQLRDIIESALIKSEFPRYASLLKSRFSRLKQRYHQLSDASAIPIIVSSQSTTDMPTEMKRKILSELPTEDLLTFLDVISTISVVSTDGCKKKRRLSASSSSIFFSPSPKRLRE